MGVQVKHIRYPANLRPPMNAALRKLWIDDPLDAGVAVYSSVPNEVRPAWAADILRACSKQLNDTPTAVQYVISIASDKEHWPRAHAAFTVVRQLTLNAEQHDAGDLSHYLLYVAENAAKVVYNATDPTDPFDDDSGAWLVRCARDFAGEVASDSFIDDLWGIVSARSQF